MAVAFQEAPPAVLSNRTVATAVIALALKGTMGLRPTPEVETTGLDVAEHGEEAYIG